MAEKMVLTAKGLDETLDYSALGLLLRFRSCLQQAEMNHGQQTCYGAC